MNLDHDDRRKTIHDEFRHLVNIPPAELERWLDTDESRSVGDQRDTARESTGHKSGRRIVQIRRTKKAELTDDDYEHMSKVVGYIKRHAAQRPGGDVTDTDWRRSLMNWGHDPLRKD